MRRCFLKRPGGSRRRCRPRMFSCPQPPSSQMTEKSGIRHRKFLLNRLLRVNNHVFAEKDMTGVAQKYIQSARPKLVDAGASIIKNHYLQDHSAFPVLVASGLFDIQTSQRVALVELYNAMSDTAMPKTFCSTCNRTLPTVAQWPATPETYPIVPDSTRVKLELVLPKVPKRPTRRLPGLAASRGIRVSSDCALFINLPPELLEIVFGFSDAEDVWNLGKVNRRLRDVVSDPREFLRTATPTGVKTDQEQQIFGNAGQKSRSVVVSFGKPRVASYCRVIIRFLEPSSSSSNRRSDASFVLKSAFGRSGSRLAGGMSSGLACLSQCPVADPFALVQVLSKLPGRSDCAVVSLTGAWTFAR